MTSSNRVRVASVRETTPGETPVSPRMRAKRITGESLSWSPEYVDSEEIRDDRMLGDPIKVMQAAQGGINFELSYPNDGSPAFEDLCSAFFNEWSNTPQRDNDGTPDSVITGIVGTTGVITVSSGAAFVAGHLVRLSGFGVSANNGVFAIVTGSATVPAVGSSLLTDESAPPGAARMKVVGFAGASGDITATSTGIASTTLDFTTLGLKLGQWIKIGGTGAGNRFATEANNGWGRIVSIAANALGLDNLPAAWSTDAGAGKTIRFWFGDQIKNGLTPVSQTIEKGFLGQTVPTYLIFRGMQVNTYDITITSRQKINGSIAYLGMGGAKQTVPLDSQPDPVTLGQVMAANANVNRLGEAGAKLSAPNWSQELTFQINNNLRTNEAVDEASPVAVREGECTVTGRLNTYFGSDALLDKFYGGTPTSVNSKIEKNNQALIWQFPRVIYRGDGNPQASAKNNDVMLPLSFQSSKDALTSALVLLDRVEYFEA